MSRWSRRKRAAEAGQPDEEPQVAPAAVAPSAPEPPPPEPVSEEPPFDPATLPPVESLTIESDITAFLRKEVPEALKRAALRKAWALDPAIRDFVGPADYAWDYNAPDGVPGFSLDIVGDVQKMLAQAMGFDAPARPAAAEPATPGGDASGDEPLPAPEPAAPPADAPVLLAEAPAEPPTPDRPEPVQRRHGSALPN
nr:DUF3306 domain-containing protein [Neoroseomonas marina]